MHRLSPAFACALLFALLAPANGDEPVAPSKTNVALADAAELPPLTPEADQAVQELRSLLATDSEPLVMLESILEGKRLGPGDGWFRSAVSQTRFPWEDVCQTYDADGDAVVSSSEFGGDDADFARLDRNSDQFLTDADFDWSQHSLNRTPGFSMFFAADADANGRVTREEFASLFAQLDTDHRGYLALDDLKDQFQPEQSRDQSPRPDSPSRSTLILALQRQEIGSLQPGPALNESAPDFTLSTVDGKLVTLSDVVGEKPLVLIFGNFTCGPFRSQAGNIEKLYKRYRDRAQFLLIYVREAHPSDGWWMIGNQRVGIEVTQPASDPDRLAVASTCRNYLELDRSDLPFLVDHVDDKVGTVYSGMPNRLYLVDSDGRIAFKSGRGPFGFKPRELEQALVLLLNKHM